MISYDVIEHGKPLQRVMKDTPTPQGAEVLVRITRSGVCHSDLHIWDGYFDLGSGKRFYVKDRGCVPPFTLGHEPFGVVAALGPDAKGVAVGQKKLVYPWIGCGACAACRAQQDNYCMQSRFLGVNRSGAYATHVLVPDPKYLVDASGLEEGFAATLACSGLTVYSAIRKLPAPAARDWVVVLGCGGLGLVALSTLRALGFERVIACDVDETKFPAARAAGARETVNSRDHAAALGAIQKASGGAVAGALDFVGMPATFGLGTASASLAKGGRYVLVGLFGGEVTLSLPPVAQRALAIMGSYVGNLQELREVVALAQDGRLRPTPVETRAAAEVNRTLDELKAGRIVGRVALDFDHA
jgi:D-arabinose 1-dehydrogenase-like Zn-dependent alcohol dehydrogenase